MVKNYLKIAFRNLLKNKGYTFINIMGLAVGIAVCVLIFRYVSHELSYDTFHEKSDQIYRVTTEFKGNKVAVSPSIASPLLQNQFPEVTSGVRLFDAGRFSPVVVSHGNNAFEEKSFGYADSSFFDVFSFELLRGNPQTALSRPNTIVITQDMARKYFGDENALGKTLTINNDREFEVTGVLKNMPDNSHFQMDFIGSLITRSSWSQLSDGELRGAQFFTYMMLEEESSVATLEKRMNAILNKRFQRAEAIELNFQPLTAIHLYSNVESDIQPQGDITYVWGASAIALLILIIACINYMNLATARSTKRSQEVGVRKVLGSDRRSLIAQFYGESAFVVVLALLCAVLLIELFNPWFNQLVGQNIDVAFLSPTMLGLFAVTGLVITLLAGSYPALLLSSFRPATVLKGEQSKRSNNMLRKGLVIFQFAVSMILIVGTLVIYQQVNYVQDKKLGYQKENVLVLSSYPEVQQRFNAFTSVLQQNYGFKEATMVSETPTNIKGGYSIDVEGINKSDQNIITGLLAHHDFTETLDIELVTGRSLTSSDYEQANLEDRNYAFLINQAMADYLGKEPQQLLGRRTSVSGRTGRIVGVVKDFHFAPLHKEIGPLVILPEGNFNKILVRLNADNTRRALDNIRETWEKMFPSYPFEYQFLNQEYDALYEQETRAGLMFSRFAFLAIFIACLGLLGLSAYTVEQRTKEIGIRKVLGASVSQLVLLLTKDFTRLVAIAFLIAAPIAWYGMQQWLQGFAYKVDVGIWVSLVAGAATLLVAWLTVSYQSIKATMVNPVESLRSE